MIFHIIKDIIKFRISIYNTLENGIEERNKGLENKLPKMAHTTKTIFEVIKQMEKESTMEKGKNMMGIGKMVKWMELVRLNGMMKMEK